MNSTRDASFRSRLSPKQATPRCAAACAGEHACCSRTTLSGRARPRSTAIYTMASPCPSISDPNHCCTNSPVQPRLPRRQPSCRRAYLRPESHTRWPPVSVACSAGGSAWAHMHIYLSSRTYMRNMFLSDPVNQTISSFEQRITSDLHMQPRWRAGKR